MSEFTTHTIKTAPVAAIPILEKTNQEIGFIPKLLATMAESPVTLEAYTALTDLFSQTDFTVTERQVILLSISRFRNCCYCLAAHSTLTKMQKIPDDIIAAVYYNQPLAEEKLEVTLAISFKTLSNYINHINDTPIDSQFISGLPDNNLTTCCS